MNRSTRLLIIAIGLFALPALWVFADLYLRVDLPGAALLAHLAFRVLVAPLEWLTDGDGMRLHLALGIWVVAGLSTLRLSQSRPFFVALTALAAAVAELLFIALAVLMEKALAAGLVTAIVMLSLSGLVSGASAASRQQRRPLVRIAVGLVAAAALYYLYTMFMTWDSGYAAVAALRQLIRTTGIPPVLVYLLVVGPVGVAALWRYASQVSEEQLSAAMGRLVLSYAAGVSVAMLLWVLWEDPGPAWSLLMAFPVVCTGALIWMGLAGILGLTGLRDIAPGQDILEIVIGLPRLLLLPCVLAALLFGHAYSVRILACPSPSPYLHKLADVSEVFRIALGPDAAFAALSLRSESRIARIDLEAPEAGIEYSDSGSSGVEDLDFPLLPKRLPGATEELVYAPALDRFYGTVVTDEDISSLDLELGPDEDPTNLLLSLSGDARKVEDVKWIPDMCWINCMHWDPSHEALLLGCEDRAGLHRYNPVAGQVEISQLAAELGDVQKVAFDPDPAADRMFTISLWKQPTITELGRSGLEVRRQSTIGGSHYDLEYDAPSNSVFASAWYGSRVRVIDGESLQVRRVIPTGFGTRALALHGKRRLLLISSVYDGVVRIWDVDADRMLAAIQVGGHVKHIALDENGDRAWFWSQCGLYRLDLAALLQLAGERHDAA